MFCWHNLGNVFPRGSWDASELLGGRLRSGGRCCVGRGALEEFLEAGELSVAMLSRMVAERKLFPCFAGSALKDQGVAELLDGICALMRERTWPQEFAARVYRVSRGERGERLAWVKVTGGMLHAKQMISGRSGAEAWEQKVDQVRIYNGEKYELAQEVAAGGICAVTGLAHVRPGDALGAEPAGDAPVIAPVLTYTVLPGEHDVHAVFKALTELADEDPMLGVSWNTHLEQIHLQLMGAVQLEVVQRVLADRFGLSIAFEPGGILYKETISQPVEGVGHFEPLRHYAEVHLRLEPLPAGSGVQFGTVTSTDELDLNWQRLALTNAMERDHLGVLTGSPVTDVRITLTGGRAHAKHTEGGDFSPGHVPRDSPGVSCRRVRRARRCCWSRGTTLSSRCRGKCVGPGAFGCYAYGCRVRAADDGGRPRQAHGPRAGIRGAGLRAGGGCLYEWPRASVPGVCRPRALS
mgnify:CR=1 FL=1